MKVIKNAFLFGRSAGQSANASLYKMVTNFIVRHNVLLIVSGFLLGRAALLSKMYPFGLAFYAVVLLTFKNKQKYVLASILLGALSVSILEMVTLLIAVIIYHVLNKLIDDSVEINKVMYGVNVFIAQLVPGLIVGFIISETYSTVQVIDTVVEAGIAGILFYTFMQCIHVFTIKKKVTNLRTEEIVCITIIVASVLTGTITWEVLGLSIGSIVTQYFVLIAAFACGPTIGTTVGVVTGLVYCISGLNNLYQMTLLAFAGLLSGLLKGAGKVGVAFGLVLASVFVDLYAGGKENLPIHLAESLCAISLFLLTPKVVTSNIAKLVPGTQENQQEYLKYARKVREATANRVNQFSEVFEALSQSFLKTEQMMMESNNRHETDLFMSKITERTCQSCFKKRHCWGKYFDDTYANMNKLMVQLEVDAESIPKQTQADWKAFCVKFDRVVDVSKREVAHLKANKVLKQKVNESRRLVADQLRGVSKVMGDFVTEIRKERKNHEVQEEQIFEAIKSFGIEIDKIEIFSLDEGNIDIEMAMDGNDSEAIAEKIVAPILSDILGEHVTVCNFEPEENPCDFTFRSGRKYEIDLGIANVAKDDGTLSGDNCTVIDIGYGKVAIALSDGMGSGARAHAMSIETLSLLRKILTTGIEEKVAIKAINAVLSLRTTEEIFSTLDLAIVDLQEGVVKFVKTGSTPSYIRRNLGVRKIVGNNLPIGIIKEFEIDSAVECVYIDDLVIMMSDGIYDAIKKGEDTDEWIARKMREMETVNPQAIADLLLEDIIRMNLGVINDDMTIIVAKLKASKPRWSNIKVQESDFEKELQYV